MPKTGIWPFLPVEAWKDTYDTLHMYTQVVGKVRLALTPLTNEWWNTPLYVSGRGLTTSAIPYACGVFDMTFDFLDHVLEIRTSIGDKRQIPLGLSVRTFYRRLLSELGGLGVVVEIWPQPVEVANPVRFDQDERHVYDPAAALRFFEVLSRIEPVFQSFRSRFRGKCSPVHFFWGSFDLAVSRFSGRLAPPREGADRTTRLAYDEEVCSLGFWPGGDWPGSGHFDACFYAYTSPKPAGIERATLQPSAAYWAPKLGEFMLPYAQVAGSSRSAAMLLEFAESAYQAGARLAGWDMDALAYRPERVKPGIIFAPEAPVVSREPSGGV